VALKKIRPDLKIGIIQEGPITLYQDWNCFEQEVYFNTLKNVDFVCVHNEADKQYIQGLLDLQKVFVFKTIYDSSLMPELSKDRKGVIISGNFSSWYGGMQAFQLIKDMGFERIAIPHSGRIREDELQYYKNYYNIELLPWVDWKEWMKILNTFSIGINLMPTRAAGTFSLNCASLGIPCIGFYDLDTQNESHTSLTTLYSKDDMGEVKKILTNLQDKDIYFFASEAAYINSKKFTIDEMKPYYQNIVEEILK
jgi:hypothetical protein